MSKNPPTKQIVLKAKSKQMISMKENGKVLNSKPKPFIFLLVFFFAPENQKKEKHL